MSALAALLPLGLLAWLVAGRRWPLARAAWTSTALAVPIALTVARIDVAGLLVGIGKGAWTGLWIALIVVPALLLYRLVDRAGAIQHLSDQLGGLAGSRPRQLLLFAWVVPSFVQGVAGFGVPIVVAAPMLVKAGVAPVAAVAAVLVGYHWSVTFGSMGSSFLIAAGTSGIDAETTGRFALTASIVLAVNAALAGALLLRRARRDVRGAIVPALVTALAMGVVLVVVASAQPALGSTAAGLAGLVVLTALLRRRGAPVDLRVVGLASLPYLGLTALVVLGVGLPGLRDLLARAPVLAPAFPGTSSDLVTTSAVSAHQPLATFGHPLVYLLLACAGTWLLYRRLGWLSAGAGRAAVAEWLPTARRTMLSLGGLTVLAAIMTESGLTAALAAGAVDVLGQAYVAVSPVLGALGTALTGSTTASNALLSPLQAGAAEHLGVDIASMLTNQTVGGNVGNMITPLNIAIAAAAVDATGQESSILRDVSREAGVLIAFACIAAVVLVAIR